VFVTFLTAGYPSIAETVPLMLAMEKGGADVIELGVPFTDPMADGKAIQDTNNVSWSETRAVWDLGTWGKGADRSGDRGW
jgi:tryptophan synthase alpha subunit